MSTEEQQPKSNRQKAWENTHRGENYKDHFDRHMRRRQYRRHLRDRYGLINEYDRDVNRELAEGERRADTAGGRRKRKSHRRKHSRRKHSRHKHSRHNSHKRKSHRRKHSRHKSKTRRR